MPKHTFTRKPEDVRLCGVEPPAELDHLEACVRELGHAGKHFFWTQVETDGVWGIQIYNEDSGAEYMLDASESFTAQEVGSVVEFFTIRRRMTGLGGSDG